MWIYPSDEPDSKTVGLAEKGATHLVISYLDTLNKLFLDASKNESDEDKSKALYFMSRNAWDVLRYLRSCAGRRNRILDNPEYLLLAEWKEEVKVFETTSEEVKALENSLIVQGAVITKYWVVLEGENVPLYNPTIDPPNLGKVTERSD